MLWNSDQNMIQHYGTPFPVKIYMYLVIVKYWNNK